MEFSRRNTPGSDVKLRDIFQNPELTLRFDMDLKEHARWERFKRHILSVRIYRLRLFCALSSYPF